MREGYYYLITALPDLSLTDKDPGYTVLSFRKFVMEQLDPKDAKLMQILYYRYDIENLVTLIKKTDDPWRPAGNFDPDELRSMLSLPDTLPEFLQHFVQDTNKVWDRMTQKELINSATTYFIDWSHTISNAFLRKWLYFDQNLKNLLIWLNCRKFGLNHAKEILGNHYEAEYLRSAKSGDLNLKAWDFQFREALRHYNNPNIALRELIINEMRWHYLDELVQPYPFGIEQLLAFAIRLRLINRNLTDSEELGNQRLSELMKGIRKDYHLPELFENA
jgi:hypothetical protein